MSFNGRGSNGQANRIRYHIVTENPLPGSTLRSIAQMYYRDAKEWERVYNANRSGARRADGSPGLIDNPNNLRVGWKLVIPR